MNRLLHFGGIRVLLFALCVGGGALPVFATTTDDLIDEPIAASCGEIVIPENFKYEEQEEERTEIEDCDNPFNADTTVSYYPTVTINDAPVSPGGTVV